MNLNKKLALSFVALTLLATSSCSSDKSLPVFITADTSISKLNQPVKVTTDTTNKDSEVIIADVGHGQKTGASISFKLDFNSFSTKQNKSGSAGLSVNTTNIQSLKVWLVELNQNSTPVNTSPSVPSIVGYSFSYNNTSVNPTVTFTNVPANSTGPQKAYYVAVAAYNVPAGVQAPGANITNANPASNPNLVLIDGTIPASISQTGGDTSQPNRLGSVVVGSAPTYIVSSTTALGLNLKLQDELGAVIETSITTQSGSNIPGTPGIVNQAGIINSLAGNGTSLFSGDNGPATSASLLTPESVSLDSSNNIFIADTAHCVIRRVDAMTGIITTVAGTPGTCNATGPENTMATNATLKFPKGIAIDSSDNIFVADTFNHVIRKFTVNGSISTVAGTYGISGLDNNGSAYSSFLDHPSGVAVDSTGSNIYISDTNNSTIRKVNSGIISRIAGTPGTAGNIGDNGVATDARLNSPTGIAYDNHTGNIYVADTNNHAIRVISSGGSITTVVGTNGASGNSGDGLPATNAALILPRGVAIDSIGNIYVADSGNNRVRKVNVTTGIINNYAGSVVGTPGSGGDGGQATLGNLTDPGQLFVDSLGSLYISDTDNYKIRKAI